MADGDTYQDRGTTKVVVMTAAPATLTAPTTTELNNGIDLSPDVAGMSGWQPSTSTNNDANLATPDDFESLAGKTWPLSTFDLYLRENDTTNYDVFTFGADLWVAFCDEGRGVGKPTAVYPVRVADRSIQRDGRLDVGSAERDCSRQP